MYYRFTNRQDIFIPAMITLFLKDYPRGFSFPGELHDFWECVYVVRGAVSVSADNRVYELTRGDIVFHKPMEIHKFHVDEPQGARLLIFSFDMTGEGAAAFRDKVFALQEEERHVVEDFIRYLARHDGAEGAARGWYLTVSNEGAIDVAIAVSYITQLFLLLRQSETTRTPSRVSEAAAFSAAADYLHAHVCENPDTDTLCRAVGTSRSGLKRLFRRYADMGIHEYFLHLKLRYALVMLRDGKSVTETAAYLGFSSQAYFSRAFRRTMGYAPSKAREQIP